MNALVRLRASIESHPWLLVMVLAPFLWILPPVPIDETRYLSIAWEMRQSGDWVALHLNGFPYFDKPPLLFWLLNIEWRLFGASLWGSRLLPLAFAAGCAALVQKLASRLGAGNGVTEAWLLLGFLYFQMFAGVVMFDILLCLCVLLSFFALVAWMRDGARWAPWVLFAGGALGMLAKGPVLLLHVLPPLLLSRWWAAPGGVPPSWRRIGAALAVCLASGLPVLLWAWAAVRHREMADAKELLVTQTAGRVVESFAHDRPFWWYLQWLLPLLLPWPLVLRWERLRAAFAGVTAAPAASFGWSASLPAFVAFAAVSGKQLHYLIPLFPGIALWLGAMVRTDPRLLHGRRMLVFCALLLAVWIWALLRPGDMSPAPLAPWLLRSLMALSLAALCASAVIAWRARGVAEERQVTCAMLLLAIAMLPLIRTQALGNMDLRGLAAQVVDMQRQGVPLVRAGHEPGLITFLARLPSPLPTTDDPEKWAKEHPQGYVLLWSSHALPPDVHPRVRAGNGWGGLRPATTWYHPGSGPETPPPVPR